MPADRILAPRDAPGRARVGHSIGRPSRADRRMRGASRLACLVALLLLVGPASLAAQQLLVRTTELATGAPVANALVTLLDSDGRTVDGGLSSDEGRRLLRAGGPGAYVVLVRRVGFRPERFGPHQLAAGEARTLSVTLVGRRTTLGAVVVREAARCGPPDARGVRGGEDGLALAEAWEALQTALDATRAARADGEALLEARRFTRMRTARGQVASERIEPWTAARAGRAFGTVEPAQLGDRGWVWPVGREGAADAPYVWHGLDERVLVSREFQASHCFARVAGTGPASGLVGLHFAPRPELDRPSVGGVVWMDPATAAPRWLDFVYLRVAPAVRDALPRALRLDAFDPADTLAVARAPGGRIEFGAGPAGTWVVRRWMLRTPILDGHYLRWLREEGAELRLAEPATPRAAGVASGAALGAVSDAAQIGQSAGGAAVASTGGASVLVRGVVWDSLLGAPLGEGEVRAEAEVGTGEVVARAPLAADGGFALALPPVGRWLVTVRAPALDAAGVAAPSTIVATPVTTAVTTPGAEPTGGRAPLQLATPSLATLREVLCVGEPAAADASGARGAGVVTGVVRDSLGRPVEGAEVTVAWDAPTDGVAGDIVVPGQLTLLVASGAGGEFRVCGAPVGVPLRVRATAPGTAALERRAEVEAEQAAAANGAPPPRPKPRPGAPARVGARGVLWLPLVYEGMPTAVREG